jgi:hypothetical protein
LTNFVTPEAKICQNGQDQKALQIGRKNRPENDVFAMIPAKSGMNSTFFYDKSLNNHSYITNEIIYDPTTPGRHYKIHQGQCDLYL